MSMIAPLISSSVQAQNDLNLKLKSEGSSLSFGDLFSDALTNNKAQLDSTNQNSIEQGQTVVKKSEPKKAESKVHHTHSDQSERITTNPDSSTTGVNVSTQPTNPNTVQQGQNSEGSFDHLQTDTSSVASGPSINQQAFLAVQSKQGLAETEFNALQTETKEFNTKPFIQELDSDIVPSAFNMNPSFTSGAALTGLSSNASLIGTSAPLNAKTAILSENQMRSEGLQNDSASSAIEANPEIQGPIKVPSFAITPALGEGPWAAALGQQALFIAKNQMSTAQLTLNPEHLGPIQVTLDMKHDQANAVFVSPHDAVRQAIEASLPQLRDMFTQAGLQLGQTQIQSDLSGQFAQHSKQNLNQSAKRDSNGSPSNYSIESTSPIQTSALSGMTGVSRGLLDTFA